MPREPVPDTPLSQRLGKGMTIVTWVLVLGLLTWLFNGWLDEARNPNQQVDSLVTADGMREVVLERNRFGHYVATGSINGAPVEFLLDTGATEVSIPQLVAARLGLQAGAPQSAQTANGIIITYATRLERITLGEITLTDIRANINANMGGDEILLGMSFLKHIEFSQRGERLTLRQYPPP